MVSRSSAKARVVQATRGGSATECEEVLYWYDPMVPGQHFDEPGNSPFMDMQLVPKCAGEEATAGVRIDPGLVQNFGIRTTEAEYGVLEPEITVTGVLAYNERDVAIVQPRAGGYVTKNLRPRARRCRWTGRAARGYPGSRMGRSAAGVSGRPEQR